MGWRGGLASKQLKKKYHSRLTATRASFFTALPWSERGDSGSVCQLFLGQNPGVPYSTSDIAPLIFLKISILYTKKGLNLFQTLI
jgi:hypothetical protein